MTFLQGTKMTDKVSAPEELRVWDKETEKQLLQYLTQIHYETIQSSMFRQEGGPSSR